MLEVVQTYPVVIPAAGIGSRMQAKIAKQYLKIGEHAVLEYTLNSFIEHPKISDIIIALHPDDNIFDTLSVSKHPKITVVLGGNERVDSVKNALDFLNKQLKYNESFVLVHDAARPCLTRLELDTLILECELAYKQKHIMGGILANPVTDTIKKGCTIVSTSAQKKSFNTITHTVDRRDLWQAQTPQMFKLIPLIEAIDSGLKKGVIMTDEASAMEAANHQVIMVEGQSSNIKVTRPNDLKLASFYLD